MAGSNVTGTEAFITRNGGKLLALARPQSYVVDYGHSFDDVGYGHVAAEFADLIGS